MVNRIEIFADILCPFAHVGIHKVRAARLDRAGNSPLLWIRAWPLETINNAPWDAQLIAQEVNALRASVAPDLFVGFDEDTFPTSSLPALAVASAAYRTSVALGETVSLELRNRLWEHGQDVADSSFLDALCAKHDIEVLAVDHATIESDHTNGEKRGVQGSPYFFVGETGFFCPAFNVFHDNSGFRVEPDSHRFDAFVDRVFGSD